MEVESGDQISHMPFERAVGVEVANAMNPNKRKHKFIEPQRQQPQQERSASEQSYKKKRCSDTELWAQGVVGVLFSHGSIARIQEYGVPPCFYPYLNNDWMRQCVLDCDPLEFRTEPNGRIVAVIL